MISSKEKYESLSGQLIGKLHILCVYKYEGRYVANVACSCGKVKNKVHAANIYYRKSTSCSCKTQDTRVKVTYLPYEKQIRAIYRAMISRCDNPENRQFYNYGGRGITVCEEWSNNFYSYYEWVVSNGWAARLNIDRAKNDLGYSPDNCRIVTAKVNSNNTRANKYITINGVTKTAKEWAPIYGINYGTFISRMNVQKMNPLVALTTPLCRNKRNKRAINYLQLINNQ